MEEKVVKEVANKVEEGSEMNNASTENRAVQEKKINICCLLSFIFSMVGILIFGMFCGLIAFILGIVGLKTFKKELQKSKWLGITGLVVGSVEVVVTTVKLVLSLVAIANML